MLYISFDCAVKTLAWTIGLDDGKTPLVFNNDCVIPYKHIRFDTYDITADHDSRKCILLSLGRLLDSKFKYNKINDNYAFDFGIFKKEQINIIIERQMNINTNSNVVFDGLVMHFREFNVIDILPKHKNTIYFQDDLKIAVFIARYANKYSANKAHSKANLNHYLSKNFLNNVSRNLSDIGDSFLQLIYHLSHEIYGKKKWIPNQVADKIL